MKFKNPTKEKIAVRVEDQKGERNKWIPLKPGEITDIPEHYGKHLGLERVGKLEALKGKVGGKEVETKVLVDEKKEKKE